MRRPLPPPQKPLRAGGRIDFIDLLRGWAVVVMIETHVVNATLSAECTSEGFFQYLKFVNGLVAPAFLFASGLAYAVTTHRKVEQYLSLGKPLFEQFGRILSILLIGYMLHIPIFSPRLFTEATDEQWQSFFQVDVLQCIAVSLLLLQILLLVLRSERRQYIAALVIAVTVVIITPSMWEIDFWTQIPWIFAGYLNGNRFSLFPLFPWLSFLFTGAMTGYYFVRRREKAGAHGQPAAEPSSLQTIGWMGGSFILLGFLLGKIPGGIDQHEYYWIVSPAFFLLRLGIVMVLCSGLGHWGLRYQSGGRPVIRLFGRESLIVYVSHLLILYGDFGPFNLTRDVGKSFGYTEAGILTIVLTGLMFGLAFFWNRIKGSSPRLTRALTIGTILLVVLSFLFGEANLP